MKDRIPEYTKDLEKQKVALSKDIDELK